MRAVSRAGARPGRVEFVDVPEPVPGADEVVVAVEAFSLNRWELEVLDERPDGWRPGQEVAGEVVAAPQGAPGPGVGERVVARLDGGGWAERVVASRHRVARLPAGVDAVRATTLPVAGLAALRAVRMGGSVLGEHVVVTGASGAVGRSAVELAALAGADVTAVSRHTDDVPGARRVVDEVAAAPGGAALVVETVGGPGLAAATGRCRPGGTVVLLAAGEPGAVTLPDFGGHGVSITALFSPLSGWRDDVDLAVLVDLVARDRLHPVVSHRADWAELPAALEALRARTLGPKAVLTV